MWQTYFIVCFTSSYSLNKETQNHAHMVEMHDYKKHDLDWNWILLRGGMMNSLN